MLVLTRKRDQKIMVGGDIEITVVRIVGNQVRIGIKAPLDKRIVRAELGPEEKPLRGYLRRSA